MPARPIRETTTLSPRQPKKPGGTPLREVTRLNEPRRKPSRPKTAKPDPQ